MKDLKTVINIDLDSFSINDIESNSLTLTDKDGTTYEINNYGDKNFLDVMARGLNPYKNRATELVSKIKPYLANRNVYAKKPSAVYLGKEERKALRIYANISQNDWGMVLGIEVIPVDKDSYFDWKFE